MIYHIIQRENATEPQKAKRFWVEAGYPVRVHNDLVLTPHFNHVSTDADGDHYQMVLIERMPEMTNIIEQVDIIDYSRRCGLQVVPRVIAYTDRDKPVSLLLEFRITDPALSWEQLTHLNKA